MSLDSVTEYALSFSGEAVHLLSRPTPALGRDAQDVSGGVSGWRHLGSVDFETAGFREALTRLRCMATGAGPESELPLTLVIPDDQILYTTLTVAPSADRERAVGQALDGLTPYPIAELAFDWHGDGDSVRVAAVARQTLREARDFAAEYGFRGVGYCADPQGGQFPGQPIFVLDPPQRSRPVLDLAAVAVTASALAVEPDAPADDLPAGTVPDDMPADTVAGAPADLPTTDETLTETAAETAAEDLALPGDAALDPEPAQKDALKPGAADADAVADAGAGKPAAAAVATPVVRHAPARTAAEKPAAPRAEAMNDRARALHDRAAEARQQRETPTTPAAKPAPSKTPSESVLAESTLAESASATTPLSPSVAAEPLADPAATGSGHRGGLRSLLGMLALLVVGLLLIWAFAVPGDRPAQVVAVEEPAQPATNPATAPAAETAPSAPETAPQTTAQSAPQTAAPADAQTKAAPQPTTEAAAPVTQDEPLPDDGPMPQVKAVEEPASALTEAEQRRVVIAAAAVAAAVVPPHPSAATPAATLPAATLPAATLPVAQAAVAPIPAPTTAPAPTAPAAGRPAQAPARGAAPATNPAQNPDPTPSAAAIRAAVAEAAGADRLTRSARPTLSPRRSTPTTSVPRADSAPQLPGRAARARPPVRPAAASTATPAAAPTAAPAAAAAPRAATPAARRPPPRPEGSAPDTPGDAGLSPAEQNQLDALILDLRRHGLGQADRRQSSASLRLDPARQLADARPLRKPGRGAPTSSTASDAVSRSAVEAALESATTPPPNRTADQASTAIKPARDSGGLLRGSARPSARPAGHGDSPDAKPDGKTAKAGALSAAAVEEAIAAAVDASPATPGGVQLSVLRSSPLPPRRSDSPRAAETPAEPAAANLAATPTTRALPETAPAALPEAAAPGPSESEIAARRALDEQLQAQAEARIRARAAADAAAEAQARAQAEARARAQAAAEERAARANRQEYRPAEIDNEPEVAASGARGGITAANVARSATQTRGIDMGRTTIIGIIGAGQASRALIRLRSGKVVTVRLGDRIDGGTINQIGDGRLTYVKSGQLRELRMLDGR